jgi:outer membrane protein TolC
MAKIRRDNLDERLKTAKQREQAELRKLAAVLDLPSETLQGARLQLEQAAPDVPERDAVRERAAKTAPDVQAARRMAERATLMVQLVERQLLPELSVGASLTRTGDVPKRPSDVMYATRAPFLAELRLTRESAEEAAEQAKQTIPAMADMQWVRLSDAVRHRKLYAGPQTKRAKEALEAALEAYRAGRVPFADVEDALSRVLEVELEAQRYRADAFVAAARLTAVSGKE